MSHKTEEAFLSVSHPTTRPVGHVFTSGGFTLLMCQLSSFRCFPSPLFIVLSFSFFFPSFLLLFCLVGRCICAFWKFKVACSVLLGLESHHYFSATSCKFSPGVPIVRGYWHVAPAVCRSHCPQLKKKTKTPLTATSFLTS